MIEAALVGIGNILWKIGCKLFNEAMANKWIIMYMIMVTGLFTWLFGLFNSWFNFPEVVKVGLHAIFHLRNLGWLASNWKSDTTAGETLDFSK